MSYKQSIHLSKGKRLFIEAIQKEEAIDITFSIDTSKRCILHWGFDVSGQWQLPPGEIWPDNSTQQGQNAVQTSFFPVKGKQNLNLRFKKHMALPTMVFVLFYPDKNRWDNNHSKNYYINTSTLNTSLNNPNNNVQEVSKDPPVPENLITQKLFHLYKHGRFNIFVSEGKDNYNVDFAVNHLAPLILHWAIAPTNMHEWVVPEKEIVPDNSVIIEGSAVQTPFVFDGHNNRLTIKIKKEKAPSFINFVLKEEHTNKWFKDGSRNFNIRVQPPSDEELTLSDSEVTDIANEIIVCETQWNSWTLMHRINLCYDFLERIGHSTEGLSLLYVWLRYSQIRQLTWQKNYNTKPRELAHAQERFTMKLSEKYSFEKGLNAAILKLMLGTVGPGADGQQVRDEILNIMHRHKIKEVSGHFMEEWHQKLHNNTTYDDIVICNAYLDFLRSNGDLNKFYNTLKAGGVDKKRLETFERPIVTDPDFVPHIKDGLIKDFEYFLGILKNVHSSADLDRSIKWSSHLFNDDINNKLKFLLKQSNSSETSVKKLIESALHIRKTIAVLLKEKKGDTNNVRNLLYLDLSILQYERMVLERSISIIKNDPPLLFELLLLVVENTMLNQWHEELETCSKHIKKLLNEAKFYEPTWALNAKSAIERLSRHFAALVDGYYTLLQPKAELLGKGFGTDKWTVDLFSEEVVRGFFEFTMSMLIHHIDIFLRNTAAIGSWQVISPAQCTGTVKVVDSIISIQYETYNEPTIIIANKIKGEEEIPTGVTGVITPDSTDIVSHIAVRARNSKVLFAVCYDSKEFDKYKALEGQRIGLTVTPKGDVSLIREFNTKGPVEKVNLSVNITKPPKFTTYALSSKDFNTNVAGGKSNNLTTIKGKLPSWIKLPASAVLPFGVCEKVLYDNGVNPGQGHSLNQLLESVEENPPEKLSQMKQIINSLNAPDGLLHSLKTVMDEEGISHLSDMENLWETIKAVWASKWNERAFISRKKSSISHNDIVMAVLIQPLVKAKYSYVVHTANPFSGNKDEIYFETVIGLGETLVGNYPGRAFGITCRKHSSDYEIKSFSSKNEGLFGKGLICRSDSNGEDLAGYAGAGLYDSISLAPAVRRVLSYDEEPLFWDIGFRNFFVSKIKEIAIAVEDLCGSAQDIEGAYDGEFYVVQTRPQVGL